jgi:hypothetical protein
VDLREGVVADHRQEVLRGAQVVQVEEAHPGLGAAPGLALRQREDDQEEPGMAASVDRAEAVRRLSFFSRSFG